jgi:hypothetical protein
VIEPIRALLGELLEHLGARRISVVPAGGAVPPLGPGGVRTLPLGGGARLEVELGAVGRADDHVDRALEEAVRALRHLAREHRAALPAVTVSSAGPVRVLDRIRAYVHALGELHGAQNAILLVGEEVLVARRDPDALERSRLELLVRRLTAEARHRSSSHADLADADAFCLSFWHGAVLVLYFAGPYPVDFVRHRAKAVARELSELLPDLDPEPESPAVAVRPPE